LACRAEIERDGDSDSLTTRHPLHPVDAAVVWVRREQTVELIIEAKIFIKFKMLLGPT
jgi:hypothetical protein